MDRHHWSRHIAALDAEVDDARRSTASCSRTNSRGTSTRRCRSRSTAPYAVPIDRQAARAHGASSPRRTQKRYDDTGLILDTILEHGFASSSGRTALATNEPDARFVRRSRRTICATSLSTFVIVPMRWLDRWGWRRLTEHELGCEQRTTTAPWAGTMGIKEIPTTHEQFATLLDDYERAHFRLRPRRTCTSPTPRSILMTTFPPNNLRAQADRAALRPRADGRSAARRIRLSAPVACRTRARVRRVESTRSDRAPDAPPREAEVLPADVDHAQLSRRLRGRRPGHVPDDLDAGRRSVGTTTGHGQSVEARGLRVARGGHEILRGLDFAVASGQVTGLLGPSGCGKTTLIRAIAGVQRHTGELTVLDRPAGSAELRRRIGYAAQTAAVYGDLTVRENLRYFADVLHAPRSDVDASGRVGRARRLRRPAGRRPCPAGSVRG